MFRFFIYKMFLLKFTLLSIIIKFIDAILGNLIDYRKNTFIKFTPLLNREPKNIFQYYMILEHLNSELEINDGAFIL